MCHMITVTHERESVNTRTKTNLFHGEFVPQFTDRQAHSGYVLRVGSFATAIEAIHVQTRILTIALQPSLFACSASPGFAAKSKTTAVPEMKAGQAQIVIMRSSQVNLLVGTEICTSTTGDTQGRQKISNNRKVVLDLPAGDYVFMVCNVPWFDFMKASVSADKRYFVIVAPHWPTHFSMRPFTHGRQGRASSCTRPKLLPAFEEDESCSAVEEPMDERRRQQGGHVYTEQWNKWQGNTAEEKATLTIRPEDSYK